MIKMFPCGLTSTPVSCLIIFLGVLTSFCMANQCGTEANDVEKYVPVNSDNNWNYLLFVVQWPESFCLYYNASHGESQLKSCIVPSTIHNWTIHGTWPSRLQDEGPQNCNSSWKFNFTEIMKLKPELDEHWPDMLLSFKFDSLWSHEWSKHGTCAATLPALRGEFNYFNKTLQLRATYNMDNILAASGIVPSAITTYTEASIKSAVQSVTGAMPDIVCYQKHVDNVLVQDLAEVRHCINKDMKPCDCPHSTRVKSLRVDVNYSPCSPKSNIRIPLILPGK